MEAAPEVQSNEYVVKPLRKAKQAKRMEQPAEIEEFACPEVVEEVTFAKPIGSD